MTKLKFAKATDITEFAIEQYPETYEGYEKIFIVPDVRDCHILRILKGYGEGYEQEQGSYILEWQKIAKFNNMKIDHPVQLNNILKKDDGGNYMYKVYYSLDEAIAQVDGGFGVMQFKYP